MPIVTVEDAKQHLRIDTDAEDSLLESMIGAAHEQVQNYLNRMVFATQAEMQNTPDDVDRPMLANHSIKAAMLLIVGELYKTREDQITNYGAAAADAGRSLSLTSRRLLDAYRVGQGV